MEPTIAVWCGLGAVLFLITRPFLFAPHELHHLPLVSVLPLLWSYLSGEAEDKRLRRLVLPFANEKKEGVVLVWALGRWMVHILDHKIDFRKRIHLTTCSYGDLSEDPTSFSPMVNSGGNTHIIRNAISQTIPMSQFTALSRRLFSFMGDHATVSRFDDLSQRYALDAVGTTVFGYDFDAIAQESDFVRNYNRIMHAIANPLYLVLPVLERVFPRRSLKQGMDSFAESFQEILMEKREKPAADMLTYMLRDVEVTNRELRDNMLFLFIAGHDTSAGGISTLIYYLAKHPDLQERARKQVLDVLGDDADPTL